MTADPVAIDTGLSVAELLVARAEDDHPGLRFEDEQWSWREVVAASAVRASWIRSVPAPGPLHIGVLLGNVPEYIFWLGAAALAGAVVVGINPTRRGQALAGDIGRTDCAVVVTDAEGARLLDGLELPVPAERVIRVDEAGYTDRAGAARGGRRRGRWWPRAPRAGGSLPPAVHLGDHRRPQGGAVHPGPAGRRSPSGRPRPTASTATTWPTAPCRCSTATR